MKDISYHIEKLVAQDNNTKSPMWPIYIPWLILVAIKAEKNIYFLSTHHYAYTLP